MKRLASIVFLAVSVSSFLCAVGLGGTTTHKAYLDVGQSTVIGFTESEYKNVSDKLIQYEPTGEYGEQLDENGGLQNFEIYASARVADPGPFSMWVTVTPLKRMTASGTTSDETVKLNIEVGETSLTADDIKNAKTQINLASGTGVRPVSEKITVSVDPGSYADAVEGIYVSTLTLTVNTPY